MENEKIGMSYHRGPSEIPGRDFKDVKEASIDRELPIGIKRDLRLDRSNSRVDLQESSFLRDQFSPIAPLKQVISYPIKGSRVQLSSFKKTSTQLDLPSIHIQSKQKEKQRLEFVLEEKKRVLLDLQSQLKTDHYYLGRSNLAE